jgi:hypothetical protein
MLDKEERKDGEIREDGDKKAPRKLGAFLFAKIKRCTLLI